MVSGPLQADYNPETAKNLEKCYNTDKTLKYTTVLTKAVLK